LESCTIRVERQLIEQLGGGSVFGPPKSRAGRRTVPFPDIIKEELGEHLERVDQADAEALVFTSPTGTPLRHSNFYPPRLDARPRKGRSAQHPLPRPASCRNALTADAGASLRELMDRMGHSSTRAALIYLHSSDERQRKLADAVG
jgi:hypothetical protein